MLITRFKVKDRQTKVPVSPYDDNTFDFETIDCDAEQMIRVMVNDFILAQPLSKLGQQRLLRRKSALYDKLVKHIDYLIIGLDQVKSQESLNSALNYFSQFKCILLESRSYNGVDNFNVKGLLFCDLESKHAKFALSKIHRDLEHICSVDETMARAVALNAPINKYNVLLNNLKCEHKFKYSNIDVGYITGNNQHHIDLPKSIDDAKSITELCLMVFNSMGFKAYSQDSANNVIRFSHASEVKTPGGFFWFADSPYRMNHYNESRTVDIYNDIKNLAIFKTLYRAPIDYSAKFACPNLNIQNIQVCEPYLKVTPEIEGAIGAFLDKETGVFCIKSAMGTGKSNIINYCIQQAHERDQRVLIITNRISVAEDFAKKYNLKVYNKDKYKIGDSLICQFDSLHHYSMRHFDVIIMDEFISLLLHSRNNLTHNSANSARFYSALNRKVIVADAFINDFALNLLKGPIVLLDNTWRDPTKLVMYDDFNTFIQVLLKTAMHEKITVSCTSLNIINATQLLLAKYGLNVCTLTASTPQLSKEKIYEYFQCEDAPWDVLIFSPTLTVGVSNLNKVKHHFHYDSSMSNDVVSSAQMCKRTRKAETIHLFVKPRYQVLKTEYSDLKSFYLAHSVSTEDNFMFDLNDYGELKVSRLGRKAILVDQMRNLLEANHKDALIYILKMHFGDNIDFNHKILYQSILNPYIKQNKANEKLLLEYNIKQLNSLNGLNIGVSNDILDQVEHIMLHINTNCPCKNDILKVALSNRTFIETCQKYNLFKQWSVDGCESEYFKIKMSNLILKQGNASLLRFCSILSNMLPIPAKDMYERKDVSGATLNILKECGYKISDAKLGIRQIVLTDAVKEYAQWIL